ncbi:MULTISPECIES: LysR substrate-binding domain-containing protein [unclassified Paenibacillus]|uniref:LysR substrate-binding domain-containing protein n=1 Tax=unclassified Paenibacillus TaxID=185978 RepID=UPI0036D2B6EE
MQEIKDEAKQQSEISGGTLRIAAIPGAMSTLVRTVSSLKKDYPSIHFIMDENNSEEIAQIRQNKLDIGLVLTTQDSGKKELEGLFFEPLGRENRRRSMEEFPVSLLGHGNS